MTSEQDYRDLIKRISKIDRKAALWLMKKAPLLHKRGKFLSGFGPFHRLDYVIVWSETPQGFHYWNRIFEALK